MCKLKIKQLMEENEITYQDISDYTGISRTNLYNYINEENKTLTVLEKIADYFSVNVSDLFVDEKKMVRGYLELGSRVYIIDCSDDLDNYMVKLNEIKNNPDKL